MRRVRSGKGWEAAARVYAFVRFRLLVCPQNEDYGSWSHSVAMDRIKPDMTYGNVGYDDVGRDELLLPGPVLLQRFERMRLMSCNSTGPGGYLSFPEALILPS